MENTQKSSIAELNITPYESLVLSEVWGVNPDGSKVMFLGYDAELWAPSGEHLESVLCGDEKWLDSMLAAFTKAQGILRSRTRPED
jgi:hypothetical protein